MAAAAPRPNAVRRPSPASTLCFSSSHIQGNNSETRRRYYALDAEMVTVVGPGELPARRAMVSIGVVNERLETLLYGRVAVPRGCEVIDGAFARMEGSLHASWEEGIPASCVSDFLERHAAAGGVLVGWEIHNDLAVAGFEKAAQEVRSGARENLPVERARIDGGGVFPVEASHGTRTSENASGFSASRPAVVGERTAGVAPAAGSNGGDGDQASRRDSDDNRGVFLPEPPPEMGQGIAPVVDRAGRGDDARTANGDTRVQASEDSAPKIDGLRIGDGDRGGGRNSGEARDAQDNAAKGSRGGDILKGNEEEARTRGTRMRVVEVTDLFRTTKGLKCALVEAYACCFDRVEEGSHNAAVDARMTMELHNLWRRAGQPEQPFGLPLSSFVVNFHSFKPSSSRHGTLWGVLRPDGIPGRGGAIEKDSGSNTYKLSFRSNRDREAYFVGLERKMSAAGLKWQADRQFVPGKKGAGDGYQLSCGRFKMHVLEHKR